MGIAGVIFGILIGGAIILMVGGYWFSFLNGKKGKEARKEMASDGDNWLFIYLAWGFLIFGIAWLIGTININFFDGNLIKF